jgi:hypothetical protein
MSIFCWVVSFHGFDLFSRMLHSVLAPATHSTRTFHGSIAGVTGVGSMVYSFENGGRWPDAERDSGRTSWVLFFELLAQK